MSSLFLFDKLLPGEKGVNDGPGWMLTTHRLRQSTALYLKSIMLSEVTSCRMQHQETPALMFIGGLLMIGGVVLSTSPLRAGTWLGMLCILVGIAFIIGFVYSRHTQVMVSTPTLTIEINFQKESWAGIVEFIDAIEEGKHNLCEMGTTSGFERVDY